MLPGYDSGNLDTPRLLQIVPPSKQHLVGLIVWLHINLWPKFQSSTSWPSYPSRLLQGLSALLIRFTWAHLLQFSGWKITNIGKNHPDHSLYTSCKPKANQYVSENFEHLSCWAPWRFRSLSWCGWNFQYCHLLAHGHGQIMEKKTKRLRAQQ